MAERIKVAIVGGGCAGVTAAFELTRPELESRYEVTLYQIGWRLGGKGASGRGVSGRIEEHGLHLWMGFYENAFRLMRECYAEARRDPKTCPIADWQDAFVPDHFLGAADWSPLQGWVPWRVNFPAFEGAPGDDFRNLPRWTVADYVARAVALVRTLLEAVQLRREDVAGEAAHSPTARAEGSSDPYAGGMGRFFRYGQLATFGAMVEALGLMERLIGSPPRSGPADDLLRFHDLVASSVRGHFARMLVQDDELRRIWEIVDLTLAAIRGIIGGGLMTHPRGFEAIDHLDCRVWLLAHGASRSSVDSAFIRALYDLAFS